MHESREQEDKSSETEARLIDVHSSGISGSWQWIGTLLVNKDGSRRFCLQQFIWASQDEGDGEVYFMDDVPSGGALFSFIDEHWARATEECLTEHEWEQIATRTEAIDATLAHQLRLAIAERFSPSVAELSDTEKKIHRLVKDAVFERSDVSNMWAGIAEGMRARAAITFFVRQYYLEHGCFPTGAHHINITVDATDSGSEYAIPRVSGFGCPGGTFDRVVTFPDDG